MNPDDILDRTEACKKLGITRQTLLAWIRKGKLKVWKRVGAGKNSALLFYHKDIEVLLPKETTDGQASASEENNQTSGQ